MSDEFYHRMVCLVTYWCRTCSMHGELRNM